MKEKETLKLYHGISNINSQFIEEARTKPEKKKDYRFKWAAAAACLCLAVAGAFAAGHLWRMGGTPVPNPNGTIEGEPGPGEYPAAETLSGSTPYEPDHAGSPIPFAFNDVDAAPVGESAMIALLTEDFCPMSTDESLAYFGVTLPEDGIAPGLALTGGGCAGNGHGVYRRENWGVFDVNWYEFTGGGKSVTLTLRTGFHFIPSPERVANGPDPIEFTEFRGWDLALFRYTDENGTQCVYTEFVLDGVTYTITASGLENQELAAVLRGLLPQKEYVPGPVAVTGTVTHVDSRTGDYFDGVEHHYSEDHDYITVDCGGTSLTVWLPGEAGRFRAGDSVTVTYNGEPATAYNIWPGQLVSVE